MKQKKRAVIHVLICVSLWALIPVVSKTGQAKLDNHQFLFWSSLISFIALLTTTFINKKNKTFLTYKRKEWTSAIAFGFLGTYLYFILLYFGYANAQGLEVLVLQYSWPIFIVILSIPLLKEKLTLRRLLSIIAGFFGVIIVLTKGNFSQLHLGNINVYIIVLLGAFSFALFSVLSKKVNLEPYTLNTVYFFTATVISFISMIILSKFTLPQFNDMLPILINGLLVNGFSYIFWIKALKKAEASFIAPFVFIAPVLAALYLIIFFDEPVLPVYGIGLLSVILAGLLNK